MNRLKLAVLLSPIIAFVAVLSLLPAPPAAYAQAPTGECVPISDTIHLYDFVNAVREDTWEETDPGPDTANALGASDSVSATLYAAANLWKRWSFSLEYVISGTIAIQSYYEHTANVWDTSLMVSSDLNAPADGDWTNLGGWDYNEYTGIVGSIAYRNKGSAIAGGDSYLDAADITIVGCYYPPVVACDTVSDYHFTDVPTGTWTLDGSATILSSTLTLNPTGSASQTLSTTLQANTIYNAVLSVTNAVSAPVVVMLGSQSQTLTIEAAGLYTATFTATEVITSPGYLLRNDGESEHYADVDWTCIYEGGTWSACLVPVNGQFTSAANWDWYRNAAWNSPLENAFLPFNQGGDDERSLIMTSAVYSLPTLAAGQFLLLTFNASAGGGQEAIVATRVLSSWHEFNVSGSTVYTYEADISAQAGQVVNVALANAGDDGSAGATDCEFPAQDDVLVDNICVYVADRPAADPPAASGGFCPSDLGFDYGCADVEALLLGYGINVTGLNDVYEAGVEVWDAEHYITWLVAALWHNVGHPICCFIVEFMRLAVGLVEHEVNVFANLVNWLYTAASSSPTWWQTGFYYLAGVSTKLATATTPGGWISWYTDGLRTVFYNLGLNQQTTGDIITASAGSVTAPLRESNNSLFTGLNDLTGSVSLNSSRVLSDTAGLWNGSILTYMNFTAAAQNFATVDHSAATDPEGPLFSLYDAFMWLVGVAGTIANLVWSVLAWLVGWITMAADVPVEAYHNAKDSVNQDAMLLAEVACAGANFWCPFWAGVYLVNAVTSSTIVYPIFIVGIILVTIVVVFNGIIRLFWINIG